MRRTVGPEAGHRIQNSSPRFSVVAAKGPQPNAAMDFKGPKRPRIHGTPESIPSMTATSHLPGVPSARAPAVVTATARTPATKISAAKRTKPAAAPQMKTTPPKTTIVARASTTAAAAVRTPPARTTPAAQEQVQQKPPLRHCTQTPQLEPQLDEMANLLVNLHQGVEIAATLSQIHGLLEQGEHLARHQADAELLGIPVMIVLAMRQSPERNVQEEGCVCLVRLTYLSNDVRLAVARAGGVEVILNALSRYPDAALTQESGIMSLYNIFCMLSEKEDDQDFPGYMQSLSEKLVGNMVPLILRSMETYSENGCLVGGCCGVLANLSCNPNLKTQLVSLGSVVAMGKAHLQHGQNKDIQEDVSAFMKNTVVVEISNS